MKTMIKLELFGDNLRQQSKLYTSKLNAISPGIGDMAIGTMPRTTWVAEITGHHPQYRYRRRFLHGRKDYAESNATGSRGVFLYFLLETGKIYEVNEKLSWRRSDRYFCRINDDGDIIRMSKDETDQWIKNFLE